MGLVLGLALLAFYRSGFDDGTTRGVVSNFLEVKWATAAFAVALWGGLLATRRLSLAATDLTWVDAGVVVLVLWAAVSLAWTPDLGAAAVSGTFALTGLLFYVVGRCTQAEDCRRILRCAIVIILCGSLGLGLAFGRAIDLGYGNENFAAETLVLGVCAAYLVRRRDASGSWDWPVLVAAGLAGAYLLFLAPSNLQYLAALAVAWYCAMRRLRRPVAIGVSLAIVALGAAAIVALAGSDFAHRFSALPDSWRERVQTWINVLLAARDAPLLGHGWGSFYNFYAEYIDRYLELAPGLGFPAFDSFDRSAGAAHNELLEILALLGTPGLMLALGIVVLVLAGALRAPVGSAAAAAGATLVAWLAMAMIEFPGQNAASATLAILVLGQVSAASLRPRIGRATLSRPAAAACMLAGLALAGLAGWQVRAQNQFAEADLMHQARRLDRSADGFLAAVAISDITPKLRLRVFPQSVVAGPAYWNHVGFAGMEERYRTSASAAPHHPVLLDLRLKYLLSSPSPPAVEIEAALAAMKRNTGLSNANVHILDTAWALRLGDAARARASLARAETLHAANRKSVSVVANAANIEALQKQLRAATP